jgi:hypothetical protein
MISILSKPPVERAALFLLLNAPQADGRRRVDAQHERPITEKDLLPQALMVGELSAAIGTCPNIDTRVAAAWNIRQCAVLTFEHNIMMIVVGEADMGLVPAYLSDLSPDKDVRPIV